MKKFLKTHYKYLLFCMIFAAVNALFIGLNLGTLGGKKVAFLLVFVALYLFLCALGFYLKEKKNFQYHQLFLVFSLVLGLILMFAMPLGMAPDETNHFRRAYEITNGHLLSNHSESGRGGNYLPAAIDETDVFSDASGINYGDYNYEQLSALALDSADHNESVFQDFGNTSLYSPLPYLPQAVGIGIGRILHLPVFVCLYLARIFNLLFWVVVLYFAIKYIPIGKSLVCLLMLSPISFQAAASCQIDGVTNAVIISMIAFVLYKIKNPTLLTKKEKLVAISLSVMLALSKIVYLPLCLLLVLLPRSCFKSKKDKIIKVCLTVALATALNLLWLALASGYLVEFQPGVDTPAQVHYILSHPLSYIATVFHTYAENGLMYLTDAFSPNLGYFHIAFSRAYVIILLLFTFYAYLSESKTNLKLSQLQKLIIFLVFAIIVALISTSLYVQWTAVGATTIAGIQGRYFTAILPLVLLLITPLGSKTTTIAPTYVFALAAAVELYAVASIVAFYL